MAELADAHDSGSCLSRGAGSSPVIRTNQRERIVRADFLYTRINGGLL